MIGNCKQTADKNINNLFASQTQFGLIIFATVNDFYAIQTTVLKSAARPKVLVYEAGRAYSHMFKNPQKVF